MNIAFRLRAKMTAGTLAILFLCMFVTGSVFISRERSRLQDEVQLKGQSLANLVAEFCASPIQKYSLYIVEEVARTVEQAPGIVFCEIYDMDGQSLLQVDFTIHGKKMTRKKRRSGDDVLIVHTPIVIDESIIGKVEIGLDLASVEDEIYVYSVGLVILVFIALTLVAMGISVFLSYNCISPVVLLSGVVKNLSKGEFVEIEIAERNDEIGDLARSFNIMSGNLKQLYQNLERKVAERTSDLEKANRQLQKEILVRKKAELALNTAKEGAERANEYKSNFVANMSHEIRTPLNAILGYAQILQDRDGFDMQTRKALKVIDQSGSHLLCLINDILDLSKIEAGKMDLKVTTFDLSVLIHNISSMFQLRCSEKNLSWQVIGIDTQKITPVSGDAGKIRQIFINLLGNAVKFTDQGGVILRITETEGGRYRFSVEDTGQGIPESEKENLFKPFNQMNGRGCEEGTGLGLSISLRFLKMMNSHIDVFANEPRGTCFCFELPLPGEKISSLTKDTPSHKIVGLEANSPVTALIVDDDQISRSMLSLLLHNNNINTLEAGNGLEALNTLAKSRVDIIFMDKFMPEMDGFETIKKIQQQYGADAAPVIMLTAAALEHNKDKLEEVELAGFLIKPCEIDHVLECIASTLGLSLKLEEISQLNNQNLPPVTVSQGEFSMPKVLHEKFMEASKFGRISQLKTLVKELEATDAVHPALVSTLREQLETYSLQEINRLLCTVNATSPRESL
ncbi:MAG: response regulator [Desulfobulbaceae bacterium]|nr:response regulator [Desulfobulbaceae bacterium]